MRLLGYIIRKTFDFFDWLKIPRSMQYALTFGIYVALPVAILIGVGVNQIKIDIKNEIREELIIEINKLLISRSL